MITYSQSGGTEQATVRGTAGWQYSVGGGLAKRVARSTHVGIGLRRVSVGYRMVEYSVTREGWVIYPPVRNDPATYDDEAVVLDMGLLYAGNDGLTAGLLLRNLNGPNLELVNSRGDLVPLDLETCVNIGVAKLSGRLTWAADIHNLFDAGGAGRTLHLGAEACLGGRMALRAGLHDGDLVFGLGLCLGPLAVDLAVDRHFEQQAGLQIGMTF